MKLYHATTRAALATIKNEGLCVRYADEKARIQAVWLHASSHSPWAVLHTQRKHAAISSNIAVIEVSVPRSWLQRFRGGLWSTTRDIPPARIGRVIDGTTYAASAK